MLTTLSPAIWMPGPLELAIIFVVAILIFGRRLPDAARSVGKSIVEFKKGLREVKDEVESATKEDSPKSLPRDNDSTKSDAEA